MKRSGELTGGHTTKSTGECPPIATTDNIVQCCWTIWAAQWCAMLLNCRFGVQNSQPNTQSLFFRNSLQLAWLAQLKSLNRHVSFIIFSKAIKPSAKFKAKWNDTYAGYRQVLFFYEIHHSWQDWHYYSLQIFAMILILYIIPESGIDFFNKSSPF